ncbi:hypothetical protein GCM10020220_060690 [Nonomuraea rubra]
MAEEADGGGGAPVQIGDRAAELPGAGDGRRVGERGQAQGGLEERGSVGEKAGADEAQRAGARSLGTGKRIRSESR